MYHGYYINLDRNTDRRARFETMLQSAGATERYQRVAGIDGTQAIASHKTSLDRGNLGCWLSHLKILEDHHGAAEHLHILEDDSVLPANAVPMIEGAIAGIDSATADWDILFTECFKSIDLASFVGFSRAMKAFHQTGHLGFQPLKHVDFAGTSSYVVNGRSVGKLREVLRDGWSQGLAIDLFIREQIGRDRINAFVTLPFLTTLSEHADRSDIHGDSDASRVALDILRRAFYHAADYNLLRSRLSALSQGAHNTELDSIYLDILRFFLSDKYKDF